MRKLLLTILVLLFFNGQAYGWGGWDTIKKLLSQSHTWTGEQTFTNLKIDSLKLDHTTETLNTDRTILVTDKPIQFFDANGTDRNVTLSPEASSTDLVFFFVNISNGSDEDLVVRNDTPTTLITIGPGQGCKASCDGTNWKICSNGIYYDSVGNVVRVNDRLDLTDGTNTSIIKHVEEPGLDGRLTFGLDETARTMVICDAGNVDTDFGLGAKSHPTLIVLPASEWIPAELSYDKLGLRQNTASLCCPDSHHGELNVWKYWRIYFSSDIDNGNAVTFDSSASAECTDTNAEQSYIYIEPKINQSSTAAYNGLKIKVTEIALGDASTGEGGGTNNLILAGTSTDPDMFKVENDGDLTMSAGKLSAAIMTFAFTTEADITDPLTGSVVLLDGDNDSENDTVDLQDGTTIGQVLYLIAAVDIDADDTCTISYGDTTCTNCPATVFNKVGENAHLVWTGSTWVVISLQNAL